VLPYPMVSRASDSAKIRSTLPDGGMRSVERAAE
jgi:hypothetical protein